MRNDYSPFDSDFDAVKAADLVRLTTVSEGWYIEYKREVPNAASVAKSISASSNTYGGWIFYGVAEKSKEESVAGSFPGILNDEADGFLQRIRQSVANHVQPSPFFRSKALFGPCEEIDLPEGRCIIMVHTPWGPDAPYVHRDGRIYRRVGDGSEPKAENDRFIIDQLSGRADGILRGYASWIDSDLETSEAERDSPFVRVFLIADFWGDRGIPNRPTLTKIREIMTADTAEISVPFKNVYRTAGATICRQTPFNNPEQHSLTWIIHDDFRSEIIIPLSKFRNSLDKLRFWLNGYDHSERFIEICAKQGYERPTVIDLNLLLSLFIGISHIQYEITNEFGWSDALSARIKISNIWRTIPFYDLSDAIDDYDRHGLPLNMKENLNITSAINRYDYIRVLGTNDYEGKIEYIYGTAISLFVPIAVSLGASLGMDSKRFSSLVSGAVLTGVKAMEVQERRLKLGIDDW